MSIIYVLIPIAILLTTIGIYLFFWAVKTEQFDDLEKQGMSILFDDENDINAHNKVNNAALKESQPNENQIDESQVIPNNEPKKQVNKQVET
jgi:cbb3-type cytochrome oxidase maturation protein